MVTADEAVKDILEKLIKIENFKIEYVVLIQPTSPFVLNEHIDNTIKKFKSNISLDSVTTLAKLDHRNHPYNLSTDYGMEEWKFYLTKKEMIPKPDKASLLHINLETCLLLKLKQC